MTADTPDTPMHRATPLQKFIAAMLALNLMASILTVTAVYLDQPVWVEQSRGRVSVVAKIDGKRFNILVFDRSLLDDSSSLTAMEMIDGKRKPTPDNTPLPLMRMSI